MGLIDKFRDIFGGDYDDDDEDYEEYDEYDTDYDVRPKSNRDDYSQRFNQQPQRMTSAQSSRRNTSQVVSIHTNVQMQVCIIKPECYEDAQQICDEVKARKPVVVNLEKVEYPIAQRIMDFLSGTCYSLNGTIQRVANNIFVIAPENVDVSGDFKEELKTKGIILPWASQGK